MFQAEVLDPRVLCAGNVVVTSDAGIITVIGDTAANAIYVTQVKGGHLKVAGAPGTTVNGQVAVTTDPVTQYVTVAMGAGDDLVNLSHLTMPYSVKVVGGAGNDTLEFHNSTFAATDVYDDAGNDTIAFASVTQSKWLQIFAGDGKDTTGLKTLRAKKGFSVNDTGTGGNTGLTSVDASDESYITTGNGNDNLSIANSQFNAFSAKLRGGTDTAVIRGTTFATYSPIDGGTGINNINREVIINTSFDNGTQGWEPGIADVPYDSSNPQTVAQLYQQYGGTAAIAVLPSFTGIDQNAFLVNARGTNFDTFGYVDKQLSTSDGLLPNQKYTLTFSGQVVIGAASAQAGVNFDFGGSTIKPEILNGGALSVSRGTSGTDLSDAGYGENTSNTTWMHDSSNDLDNYTHVHPGNVTASSSGSLFITAGADFNSGAIPGAATPSVYFVSVSIHLVPVK